MNRSLGPFSRKKNRGGRAAPRELPRDRLEVRRGDPFRYGGAVVVGGRWWWIMVLKNG